MARLKSLVAVALAGLLWLHVCNRILMVSVYALCGEGISCLAPLSVPGVMCSLEDADAACQRPCIDRPSRFYSDQACCLQDGECCCIPSYPNLDDGDEGEESSLQPDYSYPNNVIDYIGTAPYGADYRTFDFVHGPDHDDEVSASSQPVDDQGDNSSLPDDNDDGENSSGSNEYGDDSENSSDSVNDGDYRRFFVNAPIDEASASSQHVDDRGESSSQTDDHDDGENSSGSNDDYDENSLDSDSNGD